MGSNPYIVCLAFHQCDSETAHRNTRTQKLKQLNTHHCVKMSTLSIKLHGSIFQRFTALDVLITENNITEAVPLSFPAKAEDVLSKRTPGLLSLLPVEVKHDELSTPVNSRPPGCPSSDPLIRICA